MAFVQCFKGQFESLTLDDTAVWVRIAFDTGVKLFDLKVVVVAQVCVEEVVVIVAEAKDVVLVSWGVAAAAHLPTASGSCLSLADIPPPSPAAASQTHVLGEHLRVDFDDGQPEALVFPSQARPLDLNSPDLLVRLVHLQKQSRSFVTALLAKVRSLS